MIAISMEQLTRARDILQNVATSLNIVNANLAGKHDDMFAQVVTASTGFEMIDQDKEEINAVCKMLSEIIIANEPNPFASLFGETVEQASDNEDPFNITFNAPDIPFAPLTSEEIVILRDRKPRAIASRL